MGQFGTRFRLKFPQCLITKGAFCSLMNGKSTLALVGVLFAAAMVVGIATTSAFSTPLVIASSATVDNQFGMLGHITLTHTDGNGNLKSYIQTDNVIVNVGENCVAETLFDVAANTAPDGCDKNGATGSIFASGNGISTAAFSFVAVGDEDVDNGNPPPAGAEDDTTLVNENFTSTMTRKTGSPTVTTESAGTTSSAVVTLSAVFTSDGGTSTVDESGIFDEGLLADVGNMLARQTFNEIVLSAGDQLTVEWEITIGS